MSQLYLMGWENIGPRYGGKVAWWSGDGSRIIYIRKGFVLGAERKGKT